MLQRADFSKLSLEGAKALGAVRHYVMHSGLSEELIDLVFLRISQINGCAYCIDMHSRDLLAKGLSVDKLVLVPVWYEAGKLFDERERAALAWAESVTLVAQTNAPDDVYQAAAAVFSEKEIADLTIAIALMNAYNRLGVGLRMQPKAAKA